MCGKVHRLDGAIVELARGVPVNADLAREVEDHLAECDRCRVLLRRERLLTSSLRHLAEATSREGAPDRTREHVLAAFADRHSSSTRAWSISPAWLAAAAALLLATTAATWTVWKVRPLTSQGETRSSIPAEDRLLEEFVPLPAAVGLPRLESGYIIRIDVPIASLPAFGIDFIPDPARTDVEADVLVGQDGQPRAIRLVRSEQNSRSGP